MTTTKELKEIEMITSIRLEQYTITDTWINVKYFVFHYVHRRPLEMPKNDGAVFWEWKNKQVSRKSAWIIRMSAELRLLIQEKRAIDRQNRNWNTDLLWTKRERAEKKTWQNNNTQLPIGAKWNSNVVGLFWPSFFRDHVNDTKFILFLLLNNFVDHALNEW